MSDLALSSIIALFCCGFIHEFLDIKSISEAIKHKASANLMSAISEVELNSLGQNFLAIDSALFKLGLFLIITIALLVIYLLVHLKLSKRYAKSNKKKTAEFQNYFTSIVTSNKSSSSYLNSKNSERKHLSKQDLYDRDKRAILLTELRSMHLSLIHI